MKAKQQQVISRFFAPKPAPPSSSTIKACSQACPSALTVQWPPVRTSASMRKLHEGNSPRKRFSCELACENAENNQSVDIERPEACSGAVSLCLEEEGSTAYNTGSSPLHVTYKRRRKKENDNLSKQTLDYELSKCHESGRNETRTTIERLDVRALDPDKLDHEATTPHQIISNKTRGAIKSMGIPASDPSRHLQFVKTLLNSKGNGCQNEPKGSSKNSYTPLEMQIVQLKSKYKDVLLMVEVGYRYRMFGEDAEAAARVLGIVAHYDHNFLTASIPVFRLHVHVRRLVEAGYKVGVVRQKETAAIKAHGDNKLGPFMRGLSALYTRSTLEAATDLGGVEATMEVSRHSNHLMCIVEQPDILGLGPAARLGDAGAMAKGAYNTTIGMVAVETATGDVLYGQFKDTVLRSELEAHLLTYSPAELILASPLSSATEKLIVDFVGSSSSVRIERVPYEALKSDSGLSEVISFYESKEFSGHSHHGGEDQIDAGLEAIMKMPTLATQALTLALRHLKEFGLEKILWLGATFRPFEDLSEMSLSSNTLQQLEILQNNMDGSARGSLLWLMDHTHTALGARLFHHWLTHPLRDQALISARLDAVSEIAESMGSLGGTQSEGSFPGSGRGGGTVGAASRGRIGGVTETPLAAVLASLKKMPDIERGITRIFHRTATASEFVAVMQALVTTMKQLQQIYPEIDEELGLVAAGKGSSDTTSQLLKRLLAAASSSVVSEHAARFLSSLNKDAASTGDKYNLFISDTDKYPMLEKRKKAVREAEQCLESLLPKYRKLLRTPDLQYTSILGNTHLIEVSAAQRVPQDWIKVSSTKKSNRFHPPEVLQALDLLALAKEEHMVECNKAWNSFLADFASYYVDFRTTVHALAALDCLYSLAIVSRNQGYSRPEFVQGGAAQLLIEGGRHPVLEATLQDGFVPNDTHLHADHEYCQIITGPNMGGKSCYIRQVALISIMAQVGSYVPAVSARLHTMDAVYTRMGVSDSIQHGSSTFLEELSEASIILKRATPYSLVIMDELGRGTSTHDGVAIAYATLDYLIEKKKCLTLFVTHYPEIAKLRESYPGKIGTYHVSYLTESSRESTMDGYADSKLAQPAPIGLAAESADRVTFLYKLIKGVASHSFGLHVARLAQIPEGCIFRASLMAANMENQVKSLFHLQRVGKVSSTTSNARESLEDKDFQLHGAIFDDNAMKLVQSVLLASEDPCANIDSLMKLQQQKLGGPWMG